MKNLVLKLDELDDVVNVKYNGIWGKRIGVERSCRKVYRCGEYVLKVEDGYTDLVNDMDLALKHQNKREWKRWQEMTPAQRKWFAPSLYFEKIDDVRILVQKFIPGRPARSREDLDTLQTIFLKIFPKAYDIIPRNTRKTEDGRLYIVDYGA